MDLQASLSQPKASRPARCDSAGPILFFLLTISWFEFHEILTTLIVLNANPYEECRRSQR